MERRQGDRRKLTRTTAANQQLKIAYGDGLTGYARLIDLSPMGISLETSYPLTPLNDISIQTFLIEEAIKGQVIWSKPIDDIHDGHRYISGIRMEARTDFSKMFSQKPGAIMERDGRREMSSVFQKADKFAERLKDWKKNSVYVFFRTPKPSKNTIIFSSNDYLCLSRHPKVVTASQKALEKYGIGSGSASILAGSTPIHGKLQEKLAAFKRVESVLLTASGYVANVGTLTGFAQKNQVFILDEKSHASMFHACKNSESEMRVFRHNDVRDLFQKISHYPLSMPKMVLTEGLFSMDGDIGKLREIHAIAQRFNASLFLDDGHSVGILGENGCGSEEEAGLLGKCDLVTASFSKAFGAMGGFVGSTKKNIDFLRHFSHPFMFTSALPASVCAAILAAIEIIEHEPERREKIVKNGAFFRKSLKELGFNISTCDSHLIPIVVGHEVKAYQLAKLLEEEGIIANAVARPAVPRGGARVRFGVRFAHSRQDLERTLDVLKRIKTKLNLNE